MIKLKRVWEHEWTPLYAVPSPTDAHPLGDQPLLDARAVCSMLAEWCMEVCEGVCVGGVGGEGGMCV